MQCIHHTKWWGPDDVYQVELDNIKPLNAHFEHKDKLTNKQAFFTLRKSQFGSQWFTSVGLKLRQGTTWHTETVSPTRKGPRVQLSSQLKPS